MNAEAVPGRTDRKRIVTAAIKETAAQLGNTPAVCKASYIWPSVLQRFEKGTVLRAHFATIEELIGCQTRGLHRSEKAWLDLLASGRAAAPAGPRPGRRAWTRLRRG